MQINFGSKAVSCKIVYYGPGCSGKTTNIQKIHEQMPGDRKGELTSIKTEGDRTLFFDFMALDLGKVAGMDIRFQIYTVPGQVYYHATRKLVLQGADGVVFVADSASDRMEANIDSWQDLERNLAERGRTTQDLPVVVQWNKRDLADAVSVDEMNRRINTCAAPTFEAVACRGEGVISTLKCVCSLVCKSVAAGPMRSRVSSEVAVAAAGDRVAAQGCSTGAREMRFTPRRAVPNGASAPGTPSEPPTPATAVAERRTFPPPADPAAKRPAPPFHRENVPVPPMWRRPTGPAMPGWRRELPRYPWVSVTAAALLLAAAVGVAVAIHVLKMR